MAERLRVEWRRRQLELAAPLLTARGHWQRRTLLELRIADALGVTGRGEAAPLPGYSLDDLDATERALVGLELEESTTSTSAGEIVRLVEARLPSSLPAARFAVQTALLERLALRQRRPFWAVLRDLLPAAPAAANAIPLSGLLASPEPASALEQAEQLHALGIRCFKLKIGPDRLLPPQAALLAGLRSRWGLGVSLRLDANRSLALRELEATGAELASYQPELVEEPLAQPDAALLAELPFDWALDESLQGMPAEQVADLCRLPRCRGLVLKLTTLGGFGACAALAGCARSSGKVAVVSHTLDGPLGWQASAHFALALGADVAAGLWPRADGSRSPMFAAGCLQPPEEPGLGAAE
jgi:o-succinylbenzoate synthase